MEMIISMNLYFTQVCYYWALGPIDNKTALINIMAWYWMAITFLTPDGFPPQRAINAEIVSMSWRQHGTSNYPDGQLPDHILRGASGH